MLEKQEQREQLNDTGTKQKHWGRIRAAEWPRAQNSCSGFGKLKSNLNIARLSCIAELVLQSFCTSSAKQG